MKTELEQLRERIAQIEYAQAHCNHVWGPVEYEPERKEITRVEIEVVGVDIFPVEVGTGMFRNVDRWSRVCKKCGKKEYTSKQEEVAVKTIKRPKF